MNKLRLFGLSGIAVFLLFGLYLLASSFLGDVRLDDGDFTYAEMTNIEKLFFIYQFPSIFIGWAYAELKAYENEDKKWMLTILMIWPSYSYYLFKRVG